MAFEPDDYGPLCAALIHSAELCPLGPGEENEAARSQLTSLDEQSMFDGKAVTDHDMAACCRSGLWLLHNFLDESHTISQDVATSSGSYWHGIMHRREPDYSNSKYWFRQTGRHPVLDDLAHRGPAALSACDDADTVCGAMGESWDPFLFVDLCEAAARGSGAEEACRLAAQEEWRALFDYCYVRAVS